MLKSTRLFDANVQPEGGVYRWPVSSWFRDRVCLDSVRTGYLEVTIVSIQPRLCFPDGLRRSICALSSCALGLGD
jgi:hypothetical protein